MNESNLCLQLMNIAFGIVRYWSYKNDNFIIRRKEENIVLFKGRRYSFFEGLLILI